MDHNVYMSTYVNILDGARYNYMAAFTLLVLLTRTSLKEDAIKP